MKGDLAFMKSNLRLTKPIGKASLREFGETDWIAALEEKRKQREQARVEYFTNLS